MGLGFLNLSYQSIVLPYHDESTPINLTGKKMLPIVTLDSGKSMNESLDILKLLDTTDRLKFSSLANKKEKIDHLLSQIGENVHSLCMPYWIWTPEFNEASRNYFQSKKEEKRGPFKNLIHNKESYIAKLNLILDELEKNLTPYFESSEISILDIMLASHLWGMYIFPEFQFSPKMHNYLQTIKKQCGFDYHQDFWK
jgi:glutaredoxin 2